MSRLIVKNLPNGIKEEKLRKHFSKIGPVTDCSLKFTKDGKFRKFAFIGFKSDEEGHEAINQFNKTFINTSKIEIEVARDFGDDSKPRAWSKYAKDSSAGGKAVGKESSKDGQNEQESGKKGKKKKKDNKVVEEMLDELKDDPKFKEFLDAHKNISTKPLWGNDSGTNTTQDDADNTGEAAGKDKKKTKKGKVAQNESDDDEPDNDVSEGSDSDSDSDSSDEEEEKDKVAAKKTLSDLDYLKAKMTSKAETGEDTGNKDKKEKKSDEKTESPDTSKSEGSQAYMLRLKGLPMKSGEKALREFFQPLKILRIRIPKSASNKPMGIAYVGFKTEKDLDQALRRNKTFIGGKRVFLKAAETEQVDSQDQPEQPRPWEMKEPDDNSEGIGETGRLFVRNLSYSCTEEDLETTFGKFGPLTEVHLPIDSLTKKLKGFAFITYMMPEHAVKAFAKMDGKVFMGRMLHVLPGKEKKEEQADQSTEGSSYKKEKQAKQKAAANSSHNWNALFLGASAVADVLAEKYQTSKSDVLDHEMKGSLGVRMALGETQVVQETREFLTQHGVALDSFSQPNAARSKTAILVKNLPARTEASELESVFSPYGTLSRVVIPPAGVTAIVEFVAPTEAKSAFTKLAYRRFRHVPLFLEWAPMEVFTSPAAESMAIKQGTGTTATTDVDMKGDKTETTTTNLTGKQEASKMEIDSEEEDEVASVLFVKNINFDTNDDSLKEHFSECKTYKSANVATKKDMKNPGQYLSMGYGFVEFTSPDGAQDAMKTMQHSELDGHVLELKISNRATASSQSKQTSSKKQKDKKQKTTKILVRNIPFEAKRHEVEELFKVFGELKFVRLPKKMGGTGSHRGFGFVDFLTKPDAKRAFEALCQSTHLYGRRLVLEWAETEDDIDEVRKRTAMHYHDQSDSGKKKFTKAGLKESLEMSLAD